MKLTGRIALVTGASRGIGRAIAQALAEAGADVIVNYRADQAAAESVTDAIRATGRKLDASMPGAEGEGGPSAPAQLVDELACYIPAIYNEKSTLTCEVVAGKANQHNFELKSE